MNPYFVSTDYQMTEARIEIFQGKTGHNWKFLKKERFINLKRELKFCRLQIKKERKKHNLKKKKNTFLDISISFSKGGNFCQHY